MIFIKRNIESIILKVKNNILKEGYLSTIKKGILFVAKNIFPQKEIWFYYGFDKGNNDTFKLPGNFTLEQYLKEKDIPGHIFNQLNYHFGDEIHYKKLFQEYFRLPASIWFLKFKNNIVSYHWTSNNCFDVTTTIPISACDVVIFSAQTFSIFQGQGLWPLLIKATLQELLSAGFQRVYIGCKLSNIAAMRSIKKCGFKEYIIGRPLYTQIIKLTIWDKPHNICG